jgi:hypothetical protein
MRHGDLSQQYSGLQASPLTLLLPDGSGISDPLLEKTQALNEPVKLLELKVRLVAHPVGRSKRSLSASKMVCLVSVCAFQEWFSIWFQCLVDKCQKMINIKWLADDPNSLGNQMTFLLLYFM